MLNLVFVADEPGFVRASAAVHDGDCVEFCFAADDDVRFFTREPPRMEWSVIPMVRGRLCMADQEMCERNVNEMFGGRFDEGCHKASIRSGIQMRASNI